MDRRWVAAWWLCGVVACNLGKTDIGDLDTDGSSSGDGSGDSTSVESESSTSPAECMADDDCSDGCCPGFGCNFATQCVPCSPEGEELDIDGAGCCEGLTGNGAFICYAPTCGEGCPPGVSNCSPLSDIHAGDAFAFDCAPEACLATNTLALTNDAGTPGLECSGPNGSDECAADPEALQFYTFQNDALLLTMTFDPVVLADYSTAGFNESFKGVAGQLTIPDASVPITAFVESGTVSELVYDAGRLQFTITMLLDNPFAKIESDAEDCLSDDIAGECACYYSDLGSYEIAVDLAIEAP